MHLLSIVLVVLLLEFDLSLGSDYHDPIIFEHQNHLITLSVSLD